MYYEVGLVTQLDISRYFNEEEDILTHLTVAPEGRHSRKMKSDHFVRVCERCYLRSIHIRADLSVKNNMTQIENREKLHELINLFTIMTL